MKSLQAVGLVILAMTVGRVSAGLGIIWDNPELTAWPNVCHWFESQPDKDVTEVVTIPRQMSGGFELHFKVAGDKAVLSLNNCEKSGDRAKWVIRMDSVSIELSVDGYRVDKRDHLLYGTCEFLSMVLLYVDGLLQIRSHGDQIVFEVQIGPGELGSDPKFCSIGLGHADVKAKWAFQEPVFAALPQSFQAPPSIPRSTIHRVPTALQDGWMVTCEVQHTEAFAFSFSKDYEHWALNVAFNFAASKASMIDRLERSMVADFPDGMQLSTNFDLRIYFVLVGRKFQVLIEVNENIDLILDLDVTPLPLIHYIQYASHFMTGTFTCSDPVDPSGIIDPRIIDLPGEPPIVEEEPPIVEEEPPVDEEEPPIVEEEPPILEQPKVLEACAGGMKYCRWFENEPTKTTYVNKVLRGNTKDFELHFHIAANCDSRVLLSRTGSSNDGFELAFRTDNIEVSYERELVLTIPAEYEFEDNSYFNDFTVKYSKGLLVLISDGDSRPYYLNTGDLTLQLEGVAIEGTCAMSRFVFPQPIPYNPPSIFDREFVIGPTTNQVPDFIFPPITEECLENGYDLRFSIKAGSNVVITLRQHRLEEDIALGIGPGFVRVLTTGSLVESDTPFINPDEWRDFFLVVGFNKLLFGTADNGELEALLTADGVPDGLRYVGHSVPYASGKFRFQPCRKYDPSSLQKIIIEEEGGPAGEGEAGSTTAAPAEEGGEEETGNVQGETGSTTTAPAGEGEAGSTTAAPAEEGGEEETGNLPGGRSTTAAPAGEGEAWSTTAAPAEEGGEEETGNLPGGRSTTAAPAGEGEAGSTTAAPAEEGGEEETGNLPGGRSTTAAPAGEGEAGSTTAAPAEEGGEEETGNLPGGRSTTAAPAGEGEAGSTTAAPAEEGGEEETGNLPGGRSTTAAPAGEGQAGSTTAAPAEEGGEEETGNVPGGRSTTAAPAGGEGEEGEGEGVNIGDDPTTGDTPLPPSGENSLDELPGERIQLETPGDGEFEFTLRQFDIATSAFFQFQVEAKEGVYIFLSPENAYEPNGYKIGLNIDGENTNVIERCEDEVCSVVSSVETDFLIKHYVYFIEVTGYFDHDSLVKLRIRFGHTVHRKRFTLLEFNDLHPLRVAFAGFTTVHDVGKWLIYNFIYSHGTMKRTFFQTNMYSHSVGTSALSPEEKQISFAVQADAAAEILLSESSSTTGIGVFKIILGGDSNTKSYIKRGGEILAEIETIDLLDCDNYIQFWVSFGHSAIRVGQVGHLPFMSWAAHQESVPEIRFAFFESGIHTKGAIYYWILYEYYYFSEARGSVYSTYDITGAHQYHYWKMRREAGGAYMEFTIKADSEVLIAASPTNGDSDKMIEIGIAGLSNRAIFVRRYRSYEYLEYKLFHYPLVDSEEAKHYVITIVDQTVMVFLKSDLENEGAPLFQCPIDGLDETALDYMGFSGAFLTHYHFHVYLPFEYKYYTYEEPGKKLHLEVRAESDACISIAGENPDNSKMFEIVIFPDGEDRMTLSQCKGCSDVAHYGGERYPSITNAAGGVWLWVQLTEDEIQVGLFTIEEREGGRVMIDAPALITYPNVIGLTPKDLKFGIAVGQQGQQSNWLLYPYTE